MRQKLSGFGLICLLFTVSCVDNDNRCGDYDLHPSGWSCVIPHDTDSSAPVLGEACAIDADCAQYNADYCVFINPDLTEGVCSIKNCTKSPDNCPDDFVCCITANKNTWPDHCMPNDVYAQYGALICED